MGQADRAGEFLARAVYAHELAFHPAFVGAWVRGEAHLPYHAPANQPFYRAMHRLATSLSARGCHVAALSAGTLLLSLSRADDPTRLRLWLDVLALRARQPRKLLHLDAWYGGSPRQLPGWALSLALAAWHVEAEDEAAAAAGGSAAVGSSAAVEGSAVGSAVGGDERAAGLLWEALLCFPDLLPAGLQMCAASSSAATALSARWREAFQHQLTGIEARASVHGDARAAAPALANGSLRHLQTLYWERAAPLWSEPKPLQWLQAQATALLDMLEGKPPPKPPKPLKPAAAKAAAAAAEAARGDLLTRQLLCRERAAQWYPEGGGDAYRGCEFCGLRDEQVVIPEEEAEAAPPPPPAHE
eukprot:scaffold9337_cov54-Phaeocystis_antarctica.AAC.1